MGYFERALPPEIANLAIPSGDELVLPLEETKRAICIATQNLIAVLGVEVFRILDTGFGAETYSGYDFELHGHWQDYVRLSNEAALGFINVNGFGQGYGYILTTASEGEYQELPTRNRLRHGRPSR